MTDLSTLQILLLAFVVSVCQSCSPPEGWRPSTLVDTILERPVILYGLVRSTYPDAHTPTAYTVELEVYCVLKGPTTPPIINITGAGYTPGHCTSSEYLASHEYVVGAREDGAPGQPLQLTISDGEINATKENLQEVSKACGLNPVTRPSGSSSSTIECPVSFSECQSTPTPLRPRLQPIPPEETDLGDLPKQEVKSDKISASAETVTVAMTTHAAAAATALVLTRIIHN